jgi:probable F420-dependent oxidoreductase
VKFWQAIAFLDSDQVFDIARASDELGYDGITVSDHIVYTEAIQSKYPYTPTGDRFWTRETPWPDPWVLIAAMAAVTERLRFTTNVYVAPARDLFTVAKLVSTAAVVAGDGRVALGAGPGWCEEEFDLTGQPFAGRGKRFDDMIDALRALWTGQPVAHHGPSYSFDTLSISPVPKNPIPIYIGGDSDLALARAARVGDGWIGNLYPEEEAHEVVARMRHHLEQAGRSREGFEIFIALMAKPTPDLFHRFEDEGVTSVVVAPWMLSPEATFDARRASMEKFAERVLQKM